jgi:rubrerythrin
MTPVGPEILNALSAGIKAEVAAYVFYITALKKKEAAQFKNILERLAFEEKKHFHILERQHDSLMRSEKWVSTADVMKEEGLPEIGEDMLAVHRGLIGEIEQADTIKKILDIAYRLEEDAYNVYKREMERTDSPEGKDVFAQLSQFEQGHMKVVKDLMAQYA